MGTARQKLPIGIQTFREMREESHCCADKTARIDRLIEHGKPYLLSRPRCFGKSLLLDTIRRCSRVRNNCSKILQTPSEATGHNGKVSALSPISKGNES